jgi:nicotinate-nucleotide adenylyltransferase
MECARLDRIVFVPASQPPHRGPAVADARQRLEMSRLAIEGEAAFEVSDVEVRRRGQSYTADTLREMSRERPHDELLLVLGWDAARLFSTWHEPDAVRRLARIVVVTRPGSGSPDGAALTRAGLDPKRTVLCPRPTPDISGSVLRRAIARGERIHDLPPAVERYVAQHGLYRLNQNVGR